MTVDLLDDGIDDVETICVSHLKPLLADPLFVGGEVANSRRSDSALPFVWVNHIDGSESEEESNVDELVSIHTLFPKGDGGATARRSFRDGAAKVHRRMLLLARYLVDVPLPGGRFADIDYVKVFSRPTTQDYGNEQILQRVGRYRIGLSYVKLS